MIDKFSSIIRSGAEKSPGKNTYCQCFVFVSENRVFLFLSDFRNFRFVCI